MIPDNNRYDLPPSVVAYLSDPAIRTSVDALLEVKTDATPPGLALGELGEYLSARAAAEVTRHEYASSMYLMWREVWASKIPRGWQPADLAQLAAEGYSTSPADIWDESWFAAWHERPGYILYTFVSFGHDEFLIGVSLEDKEEELIGSDFGAFIRHKAGDYEGWFVAHWPYAPSDPAFDLSAINLEAQKAVAHIEQLSSM